MSGADTRTPANATARLVSIIRAERERLQGLERELSLLLQQETLELEQLAQRRSAAEARLAEVEREISRYQPEELKGLFQAFADLEKRLFMHEEQREQIEYRLRVVREQLEFLAQIDELARPSEEALEPSDAALDAPLAAAPSAAAPPTAPEGAIVSTPLAALAAIIETQEVDRQRMAQQIHDGPVQALSNVVLRAEICERLLDSDVDEARRELAGLRHLVVQALHEARRFIFDLRPMMIDDLGLVPTLRRYAQTLAESEGLHVDLVVTGSERRVAPMIEVGVFRIVQEALDNVRRHAGVHEAEVHVGFEDDAIVCSVRDRGVGCDPTAARAAAGQARSGLQRVADRVAALGGSWQLHSAPERGTTLDISLPLDAA